MKKINTVETKIALILTGIIIVGVVAIGLIIAFGVGGELFGGVIDGLNGTDFDRLGSFFGVLGLICLTIIFFIYIVAGTAVFVMPIWVIWGVIKLIKKFKNNSVPLKKVLNRKVIIVSSLSLLVSIIFIIGLIMRDTNMEKCPEYAEEGTIGALAYNYCSEENVIFVKEFDKYEPYLVLHNNDYGEGTTLLLRKNVIGGYSDYTESMYGGKIFSEYLNMYPLTRYENSVVDAYLQTDFQNRFDQDLLKTINNTPIGLCDTTGSDTGAHRDEYYINRKFFILSIDDMVESKKVIKRYKEICNNSDNNKVLKYFSENNNNLNAFNDVGEEANWWLRNHSIEYYYMVAYGGYIRLGYENEGIRPAFTINSSVNYKQVYDEEIGKDIYILDI